MVSTAREKGGAARIAFTLANGIQNVDPSISITFYHSEDRQQNNWVRGMKRPLSREINAVLSRLGGARLVQDRGLADQIISETQDADLLHIHNLHGYYLNYEKLLLAWKDRPIVWTWHDMWGATGRCGISFDCSGWQNGCSKCPHKDYYPAAWVDFAAAEFSAKSKLFASLQNLAVVSPSQWLADIATERQIFKQPVWVIPNPVDIAQYQVIETTEAKSALGLDLAERYLLFIAADCKNTNKGYNDFLQIIEQNNLRGLVVGAPPTKRSNRIIYAGAIRDAKILSKYYSAADLMIITSKQENYPNTVMESMACGTPVMGYAVGGIPSQLPDFWDGVVPLNDIQNLTDKIKRFLKNSEKKSDLQYRFRKHIEANADLNVISLRYSELYHELCSSQNQYLIYN